MELRSHHQPGLLRLEIEQKALVRRPDWEQMLACRRPDTVLIILDLRAADFISSLFLQATTRPS
ncbi:MAG: hypothetical protein ACYS8K_04615 [Planctomycetota bacterium]